MGEEKFNDFDACVGGLRRHGFQGECLRPFFQYPLGILGSRRPDMLGCNARRFQTSLYLAPVGCFDIFSRCAHGCIFLKRLMPQVAANLPAATRLSLPAVRPSARPLPVSY